MEIDLIHGINESSIKPVKADPERKPAFSDIDKQALNAVYNRVMKKLHREPAPEIPPNNDTEKNDSAAQQWLLLHK